MAYKPDFEHPSTELLHWLEQNLWYYEEHGDEKAVSVFRDLLEETRKNMHLVTRSLGDFPAICDKNCPHVQCSSWGNDDAIGKPCRNLVPTNEQLKQPQIRSTEDAKEILESIPRNSRMGRILDRLDALEKTMTEAEKIVKEPELHRHLVKNRPRFCEPLSPQRRNEEE
jgi:hypothetical protein